LWDETSLQSRRAEQTVERLRKPEDGTIVRAWHPSREWTLPGGAAKRAETLGRLELGSKDAERE